MKKLLRTLFFITAVILTISACSVESVENKTVSAGEFSAVGSGAAVSKRELSGETVVSFDKSAGFSAVSAGFGNKMNGLNYLIIKLSADKPVNIAIVIEMFSLIDPNASLTLEGSFLVDNNVLTVSALLGNYENQGYEVVRSVTLYPAFDSDTAIGNMYIKQCYMSGFYVDSQIIDLKALGNDDSSGGSDSSDSQTQSSPSGQSGSQSSQQSGGQTEQIDYLWQKYEQYFPIGYAIGADHIDWYKGNLDKHFNSFTCENEMKLYSIAPYSLTDDYFSAADQMISYVRSQGKRVRGHALIWYNGAPGWLTGCRDKNQLLSLIEQYVTRVVNHFGDSVYCWDVVNEAVGDDNQYRSTFYDVAGLDFIKTAFRAARAANPNIKLFYNDYNMDKYYKRQKVLEMIDELQRDGVPIDGVGMQGHYNLKDTRVSDVEQAINDFASRGLDVQITELDVKNYGNQNPQGQAELYRQLFEVFRRHADVITGVTFWNVADDYSWLDYMQEFSYYGTGKAYATIFDDNHNKKTAFNNIFNF